MLLVSTSSGGHLRATSEQQTIYNK